VLQVLIVKKKEDGINGSDPWYYCYI